MAGEKTATAASWCPRLQKRSRQARSCRSWVQPLGKLQKWSLDCKQPTERQAKKIPLCQGWLGEAGKGSTSLGVLVVLHPGERLSPGFLAQTVCVG